MLECCPRFLGVVLFAVQITDIMKTNNTKYLKMQIVLRETYTRINKYPAFCDNSVFGG